MKITQRGGDGEMHMDELKSQKIWLCWNYETRKGKRTKVPISASGTATGTNSEYAHTWVTYDEAIKAADKHGYNGVGFTIPQGYFFLESSLESVGRRAELTAGEVDWEAPAAEEDG